MFLYPLGGTDVKTELYMQNNLHNRTSKFLGQISG